MTLRHPDASAASGGPARVSRSCLPVRANKVTQTQILPLAALAIRMTIIVAPLAAQRSIPPVPIRPLGAVVATSAVSFMQIQHLRALSDGRVLINDPGKRQVILLDTSLANPKIEIRNPK